MAMEETPGGEARMTVAAIVATFKDAERDLWDLDMKIESELNRLYAKKTTSGLIPAEQSERTKLYLKLDAITQAREADVWKTTLALEDSGAAAAVAAELGDLSKGLDQTLQELAHIQQLADAVKTITDALSQGVKGLISLGLLP